MRYANETAGMLDADDEGVGRHLAAQIDFQDGARVVVPFDELADVPPARLAGAVIRLVTPCPCCGAWRAPTFADLGRLSPGGDR